MPIILSQITKDQAEKVIHIKEGHFADAKAIEIEPSRLTKTASAFANADGGEIFIGIAEVGENKTRFWRGFKDQEAANGHIQSFEILFPLGKDVDYEFLHCDAYPGLVLKMTISKTPYIVKGHEQRPVCSKRGSRVSRS